MGGGQGGVVARRGPAALWTTAWPGVVSPTLPQIGSPAKQADVTEP